MRLTPTQNVLSSLTIITLKLSPYLLEISNHAYAVLSLILTGQVVRIYFSYGCYQETRLSSFQSDVLPIGWSIWEGRFSQIV